jgi:hypothetical protein
MRSTVTSGSEIELTAPVGSCRSEDNCTGVRPCSLAFAASAAAPSAAFMVTVTVRGGGGDAVTVMSSAVNGSPRNAASAAA